MNGREPTVACPEQEPDFEAYLFGTLDGPSRARVEEHLGTCPACRLAVAEARTGLRAIRALAEAPAPFLRNELTGAEDPHGAVFPRAAPPAVTPGDGRAERHRAAAAARWPSRYGWAAAAAVLLVGVAVGRWSFPAGGNRTVRSDPPPAEWIQPAQIEALARAEVLLDLGVPWLESLQAVLAGVIDATETGPSEAALGDLRQRARRLVLDGRKLRAALDAERDAELVATVIRAEVFLEEVAALGPGRAPDFFSRSELSDLGVGFAAADARGAADRALLASGWIASESGL